MQGYHPEAASAGFPPSDRRAIPTVEADSALGWEPMMRYVCGRPNLEWKPRQLDEAERTIKAR